MLQKNSVKNQSIGKGAHINLEYETSANASINLYVDGNYVANVSNSHTSCSFSVSPGMHYIYATSFWYSSRSYIFHTNDDPKIKISVTVDKFFKRKCFLLLVPGVIFGIFYYAIKADKVIELSSYDSNLLHDTHNIFKKKSKSLRGFIALIAIFVLMLSGAILVCLENTKQNSAFEVAESAYSSGDLKTAEENYKQINFLSSNNYDQQAKIKLKNILDIESTLEDAERLYQNGEYDRASSKAKKINNLLATYRPAEELLIQVDSRKALIEARTCYNNKQYKALYEKLAQFKNIVSKSKNNSDEIKRMQDEISLIRKEFENYESLRTDEALKLYNNYEFEASGKLIYSILSEYPGFPEANLLSKKISTYNQCVELIESAKEKYNNKQYISALDTLISAFKNELIIKKYSELKPVYEAKAKSERIENKKKTDEELRKKIEEEERQKREEEERRIFNGDFRIKYNDGEIADVFKFYNFYIDTTKSDQVWVLCFTATNILPVETRLDLEDFYLKKDNQNPVHVGLDSGSFCFYGVFRKEQDMNSGNAQRQWFDPQESYVAQIMIAKEYVNNNLCGYTLYMKDAKKSIEICTFE